MQIFQKYLILFLLSVSALTVFSQKIEKQVILYESPGEDTKLINAYGVINLHIVMGNIQRNDGPILNEVIDLGKNGFLIRNKLLMIHYSNDLKKVGEFDLSDLYSKKNGIFKYFVYPTGVMIWQDEYSEASTNKKFGNYDYKNGFTVKDLYFDSKVKISSTTNYEEYNTLYMALYYPENKEKERFKHVFYSVPGMKPVPELSGFNIKNESFGKNAEDYLAINDSTYFVLDKPDKNFTKLFWVGTRNKDGSMVDVYKGSVDCSKLLISKTGSTVVQYSYKGSKSEYPLLDEEKTVYHDKINQIIYFVYNLRLDQAIFTTAINYKEKKSYTNFFSVSDDQNKKVNRKLKEIEKFSSRLKVDKYDREFYPLRNGLLLNLHTLGDGFQIAIDNTGKILRVDKSHYNFNNTRHRDFNLLPKKNEVLFVSKTYKPNKWDFILTFLKSDIPEENLFHILNRGHFDYIIQFEKQNSRINCYKVTYD
ncbi:hypothetical protein MYP_876 [Sporocytophaga myxococcoides]|uniref:Uncharacterized protein n=1 Tax=Sporocytophaga myxococcoides TaxID=153721 RepID=A0A098LB30_9BACT|nr:hypothetical protein [Sporocytophaga myxococcoides]GAL83649.1 hypothetical protein MYP_876 [Sporocytophaga myxococcoides]